MEILEKILDEWKNDADIVYSKSHAVSYTLLSYHTAYLKAHYPDVYWLIENEFVLLHRKH